MRGPFGATVRPTINSSMTVKFLHVRAVDDQGIILPTGGITVAYTITDLKGMSYIYLTAVKCRSYPIIDPKKVKRRDVKRRTILEELMKANDASLYDATLHKLDMLSRMPIYTYDLFDYKKGAALARERLQNQGPLDVIPLEHPISQQIVDWISNELWPNESKAVFGYKGDDMGFAIDIYADDSNRWCSTFEPSQSTIVLSYPDQVSPPARTHPQGPLCTPKVRAALLKCREEFCWHGNTGNSLAAGEYAKLVDMVDDALDAAREEHQK